MKIANSVSELIGNTPLIKINKFGNEANILAKCEFLNPSHSVKDRIALNMIESAIATNKIDKNQLLESINKIDEFNFIANQKKC